MKHFLAIFIAAVISGCVAPTAIAPNATTQNNAAQTTSLTKNAAIKAAINKNQSHKLLTYLQDSQQTNTSPRVSQLVQIALDNPNDPEPLYGLGYIHMQNGINTQNAHELDLAEIYLKAVLTQLPGNQSVLQALYNVEYDNTLHNRNPEAYQQAQAIFQQLPESARGNYNPPSIAKFGATAKWQEQQHQRNQQALRDILLEAIHESPRSDTAYIQLAKFYRDDHYFSLALATLKLGEENIHSSLELYQALAETYNKRAQVNGCNYEHKSDIANAAHYYQLSIPLKPDDANLHYDLAQTFFDQHLDQLGMNEASIALDLKTTGDTLGLSAQDYAILGYPQKANALLQRALANGYSTNNAGYHEIYMYQGDWQNAAKGFAAYIKGRDTYSVYDLIKSDMIAQQAQVQPWIVNKKITLNSDWEEALYKYWSTKINADDLKKAAHDSCEKTEYYFYTGYKDVQAGQTAQAKTKFTAALNQNTYRFIERPLARYFLQK